MQQRLMIADDSAVICKVAKRILGGMNFQVVEASNSSEALMMCEAQLPAILIIDAGMPDALSVIHTVVRCWVVTGCGSTTAPSKTTSRC